MQALPDTRIAVRRFMSEGLEQAGPAGGGWGAGYGLCPAGPGSRLHTVRPTASIAWAPVKQYALALACLPAGTSLSLSLAISSWCSRLG